MTAAGPAFILPYNSHEPISRKKGTNQQKRKIASGRGSGAEAGTDPGRQRAFSFLQAEGTARLPNAAGICTGSGGGPPGIPTARACCPIAYLHTEGFFKLCQMKNRPKGKHTPRPARVNSGFKFSGCAAIRSGTARGKPPVPCQETKKVQGTFPLPIRSRRGERDFSPDVKEKNLSYSLRTADTFHSFSPKKRATGQAMRGDLPQVAA